MNEPDIKTSSDSDTDMAECSNGLFDSSVIADLNHDQNDHVQKCLKSRRVLEEDELLRTSKHVENDWRQLGNALKFNFTKLDALELEQGSSSESVDKAVLKMFQDWMAWKKEKATVGRLTKALYLNNEWEAILSLNP